MATMPGPYGGPMYPHSVAATAPIKNEEDEGSRKRTLFGDVPEAKRRKFILVEDSQRGTRVRVRVSLDQVKMDDMPDAHLNQLCLSAFLLSSTGRVGSYGCFEI